MIATLSAAGVMSLSCWVLSRFPRSPRPRARGRLGVVPAADLGHLRPALVPRFLHDRRNFRIRGEALPPLGVPVKDHPDAVFFIRIAEHDRTLGSVLPALLGTLG